MNNLFAGNTLLDNPGGDVPPAADGGVVVPARWAVPAPAVQALRLATGSAVRLAFAPTAGSDPTELGDAARFSCRHPLTGVTVVVADAAGIVADRGTFVVDLSPTQLAPLDPLLTYRWDVWRQPATVPAQIARGILRLDASRQ